MSRKKKKNKKGIKVKIGPSLIGDPELHWFVQGRTVFLIKRDPSRPKERPGIVLDLDELGITTPEQLRAAMLQGENDLIFGKPNATLANEQ